MQEKHDSAESVMRVRRPDRDPRRGGALHGNVWNDESSDPLLCRRQVGVSDQSDILVLVKEI